MAERRGQDERRAPGGGEAPRRDYIGGGWSGDWGTPMAPALGPTYDVGAGEAGRYGEAGNAPRPAARRRDRPPAAALPAPGPAPASGEPPARAARPPRGYRRRDERIWDDVCLRIAGSGLDAGAVDVTVAEGVVSLTGAVATRAEKWALEEIAERVSGVVDVNNRLRVDPDAAELRAGAAAEGGATTR